MTNAEKGKIQKEIVDLLPEKPHGRLLLAPRIGKSKLAIDIIKRDNPKTILWVTPLAELATVAIPEEFNTWKAKKYLKGLTTVTWTSLDRIEGHFEMIILDEEQFSTENNTLNLRSGKLTADYIISMTGTETKHESKLDLYKQLNLPVLYKLDINQAVDIGILSNYVIKVIEVDMTNDKVIKSGTKDKPFFVSETTNYQYLSQTMKAALAQKRKDAQFRILNRMRAIYNSPSKTNVAKYLMKQLDGRKLFFCASIDQAESICENTYHSKSDGKNLRKFINGEVNEVAMVNAGGVGVTYKEINHLVIVQTDSDKNGLTSQKVCRSLLQQPDYKATIWIICLTGTQDEKWVESTLENFDKTKIEFIRFKNIENQNVKL